MRNWLDDNGFIDIETPMLTKATPEGARDYLVPSAHASGKFFALPQSPQIFKQLLMVAGFDRYYQIVRCFRDEDLRADRQPEFTQLDIETSFLSQEDIMQLMEGLIRHIFKDVVERGAARRVPAHDLCRGDAALRIRQAGSAHCARTCRCRGPRRDCEFKVFAGPAKDPNGRVAALRVPGGGGDDAQGDRRLHRVCRALRREGPGVHQGQRAAKGREGLQSPILKFLSDAAIAGHPRAHRRQDGDLIFFGADSAKVVNDALGALRIKVGHDLEAGLASRLASAVGLRLPDVRMGRRRFQALGSDASSVHRAEGSRRSKRCAANPGKAVAKAYDMVLNGSEIGGGSVRIHRQDMQSTVFDLLGIDAEEARRKFGFLLDALKFGAPPHGGIAFGLDRLAMLMSGATASATSSPSRRPDIEYSTAKVQFAGVNSVIGPGLIFYFSKKVGRRIVDCTLAILKSFLGSVDCSVSGFIISVRCSVASGNSLAIQRARVRSLL
jgi:aspartyl-tRNA synthetase